MNQVAFLILLGLILIAAIFFIPQLLVRRAMGTVIKRFRKNAALSPASAKTLEELGMKPQSFIDKMMKPRDYKPQAIQLLMRIDIIQATPEGKLFLSEQKLATTQWRSNPGF